jgi:hypothetical protein
MEEPILRDLMRLNSAPRVQVVELSRTTAANLFACLKESYTHFKFVMNHEFDNWQHAGKKGVIGAALDLTSHSNPRGAVSLFSPVTKVEDEFEKWLDLKSQFLKPYGDFWLDAVFCSIRLGRVKS